MCILAVIGFPLETSMVHFKVTWRFNKFQFIGFRTFPPHSLILLQAINLAEEEENVEAVAQTRANMAVVLAKMGDFQTSIEVFEVNIELLLLLSENFLPVCVCVCVIGCYS